MSNDGDALDAVAAELYGLPVSEFTAAGRQARQLAGDAGQRVGDGAVRELEETLHAALADPDASDEVQAGHLTSALSYAGFGSVEVTAAGSAAPRAAAARAPSAPDADGEALRQAQAELADARQAADELEGRLEEARRVQAHLEQQVQEASEQLEHLRAEAAEAATAARE